MLKSNSAFANIRGQKYEYKFVETITQGYYDPATGERVSVTPQQPQNQGYYDPNDGGQGYYDPNQQMNQGYYDPNQQNMNQGYYDPNQGGGYNPNNPY